MVRQAFRPTRTAAVFAAPGDFPPGHGVDRRTMQRRSCAQFTCTVIHGEDMYRYVIYQLLGAPGENGRRGCVRVPFLNIGSRHPRGCCCKAQFLKLPAGSGEGGRGGCSLADTREARQPREHN